MSMAAPNPQKPPVRRPEEHFWNVDLRIVFKDWLSQLWAFALTAITFLGVALPVLIAIFVLWYLAGFPRLTL